MEQRPTSHSDSEQEKVYKFNGKEYTLSPEVVHGGCQGCAFYDRLDCATRKPNQVTLTRAQICNKEHKIFKRLYNHK